MKKMFKYWPLIKKLTLREIKARYKQSFLGYFWVILNPFFQMLIMSFVFSKILGRVGEIGVPYPVFLFVGLLPWTFFSVSLNSAMGVLAGSSSLIKKIYFPREILVLSTILAKAVDFFLSALIIVVLMLYYKLPFYQTMFLFIPVFVIQFAFVYSFSLLLSVLNVFYKDIQYLFGLILRLWFYLTPVIYLVEFFPEKYRWIFKINPMSVFINAYRQVLLGGDWPSWSSLGVGALVTGILFIIANVIFHKLQKSFADVV
jgi:lipopolysaccharide transport system permease protein